MEKHVSTLQSLTSGNAEVIELAKELKVPSGEDAVYFECLGHNSKEDYMSFFSFDQKNLIKGSYFPGSDPRARTAVNAEVSSSFRAHGRAADAWHVPKKSSSFQADGHYNHHQCPQIILKARLAVMAQKSSFYSDTTCCNARTFKGYAARTKLRIRRTTRRRGGRGTL